MEASIEAFIPPDAVYEVQESVWERELDDFVVSEVASEGSGNDGPAWSWARAELSCPRQNSKWSLPTSKRLLPLTKFSLCVSRRCAEGSAGILIAGLEEVVWIESGLSMGFRKFMDT